MSRKVIQDLEIYLASLGHSYNLHKTFRKWASAAGMNTMRNIEEVDEEKGEFEEPINRATARWRKERIAGRISTYTLV